MSSRGKGCSLYVRNFPTVTTQDELRDIFEHYGPVKDIYIPRDHYTRQPRGFAYIEFEDVRDAEEAQYKIDNTSFFGRDLEVCFAQGDRKTPGQMRSKDSYGGRSYNDDRSNRRRRYSRSYSRSRSRSPDQYRRRRNRSGSSYHDRRSSSRSRSRSFERRR